MKYAIPSKIVYARRFDEAIIFSYPGPLPSKVYVRSQQETLSPSTE